MQCAIIPLSLSVMPNNIPGGSARSLVEEGEELGPKMDMSHEQQINLCCCKAWGLSGRAAYFCLSRGIWGGGRSTICQARIRVSVILLVLASCSDRGILEALSAPAILIPGISQSVSLFSIWTGEIYETLFPYVIIKMLTT